MCKLARIFSIGATMVVIGALILDLTAFIALGVAVGGIGIFVMALAPYFDRY